MPNRLGSAKLAVSALIAMGAIGGSVAYAYPPAEAMRTSVMAQAVGSGGADVSVTVYNANPTCQITIDVPGNVNGPVVVGPRAKNDPHATTITRAGIRTNASNGKHSVKVTATNCTDAETTQTVFDIIAARLETSATRYVRGDRLTVRADAFTPNATITFRLAPWDPTLGALGQTLKNVTTKRGRASVTFPIPGDSPTGSWVIAASTPTASNSTTIHVTSS